MGFFGKLISKAKAKIFKPQNRISGREYWEQKWGRKDKPEDETKTTHEDPWTRWYSLISSNVDRIRYSRDTQELEVIFKNGQLYTYDGVEPDIFLKFVSAPSPGQFVHYVLIQYGYAYHRGEAGHEVTPAAAPRFDEQPYAVPDDIQEIQARAGRKPAEGQVTASTAGLWNKGEPVSGKAGEPPFKGKFPPVRK